MSALDLSNYAGLTAVGLLTLNILLGLLLSVKYNPVRRWPHRRMNTVALHNWTGYTALAVIDYHVELDGHYYSVPHALVRKTVEARITDVTVEILHAGRRVASHPRCDTRGRHTTVAEHMPAAHRAHLEWSPGRFLQWATDIGPATHQLVDHLLTDRPHPEMGYRSCLGLLSLARQYGHPRLEAACVRALAIGSRTRKSVLSILHGGLDRQPLPTPAAQTDWVGPDHDNLRGPAYYLDTTTTH